MASLSGANHSSCPEADKLRRRTAIRSALAGVNAAIVGLLLAALYTPVWTFASRLADHPEQRCTSTDEGPLGRRRRRHRASGSIEAQRQKSSLLTRRWRGVDSNLYGAFPAKSYFWFVPGSLFGAEKPFFVPSLRSGSRSAQKAVKGPKR
jgi:hypothetical protein